MAKQVDLATYEAICKDEFRKLDQKLDRLQSMLWWFMGIAVIAMMGSVINIALIVNNGGS